MADYDFNTLNDKEFEVLCIDLLSTHFGKRFERFKAGKDAGVDGRFFKSDGSEEIIQCKHWVNTPFTALIRSLKTVEKPKILKLNPERYFLCLSHPLSRVNKRSISHVLAPFINDGANIFGKEDLNDLLSKHPEVERRHYKLWLQTSNVLSHLLNVGVYGRSDFSLAEVKAQAAKYAVTSSHSSALTLLNKNGFLVISGDPGVGKSTLAEHLALQLVADGYKYVNIVEDVKEGEDIFDNDSKQIFYFDDFLGRNYLDALRGYEGAKVMMFVRRVAANKNKRFILTSRSTVLNQGWLHIDRFEHDNLGKSEYELRITGLPEMDRAHILYNHIWHSGLGGEFVNEIYAEKRYKQIIAHKNFNPRLISFITDSTRLQEISAPHYWEYIQKSLADPSHIWENPFVAQLDNAARAIVLLVVINGRPISEPNLSNAYARLLAAPGGQSWSGKLDFISNIKLLTGSLLTRRIDSVGRPPVMDLFNPSIGDFVLQRYANDSATLRQAILSLRSLEALNTLESLRRAASSRSVYDAIATALILDADKNDFADLDNTYVCKLFRIVGLQTSHNSATVKALRSVVLYVLHQDDQFAGSNSFYVIQWAYKRQLVTDDQVLEFIARNLDNINEEAEFAAIAKLLAGLSDLNDQYDVVLEAFKNQVLEVLADDLTSFIEVSEVIRDVNWGEYAEANRLISKAVLDFIVNCGIPASLSDAESVVEPFDVQDALDSYIMNSDSGDYQGANNAPSSPSFDQVDDLFERDS